MNRAKLSKLNIPDDSGVYFFLGKRKEILYIGKATSLRNRVRSYFTLDLKEKRSELIEKMVEKAISVEWTVTDSVLEALILETNLIRTHKPRFNTISKDDKSYNHLVITKEEYPRVLVVRGKDLVEKYDPGEILYEFGPFPSGSLFKSALKIVKKLFRFYDTRVPIGSEKSKLARGVVDFNRQIGLYPKEGNRDEYLRTIKHLRLFFSGQKHKVIKDLEQEMKLLAKVEKFEEAHIIKKKISALQHIEDVSLIDSDTSFRDARNKRVEAYDVSHFGGEKMVGVMVVLERGEPAKSEYRKFKIKSIDKSNDPQALKEVLERRLEHDEWPLPQLIVVDGGKSQKSVAEKVLKQAGLMIPVVAVTKDEHHRPKSLLGDESLVSKFEDEILLANHESHRFSLSYHRQKRRLEK